jgi:hypothetical protein
MRRYGNHGDYATDLRAKAGFYKLVCDGEGETTSSRSTNGEELVLVASETSGILVYLPFSQMIYIYLKKERSNPFESSYTVLKLSREFSGCTKAIVD